MTSSSRGSNKAKSAAAQIFATPKSIRAEWLPRLGWLADFVADALARPHGGKAMAADELAAKLSASLPKLTEGSAVPDLESAIPAISPALFDQADDTILTKLGPCHTADLCRLVCAIDSAASLATGEIPEIARLREGVRGLAAALELAHGGRSIEVRIPPVIAIQLAAAGDGPTHRRGTPPNVVEADAQTFLRIATGTLSWEEAISAGLNHSGAHADEVAGFLPVLDLR